MIAMGTELHRSALIVIDVQQGFDHAHYWGQRNNPNCERNIVTLVEHWRSRRWPIVFVRHDSDVPDSPLSPEHAGNRFKNILNGDADLVVGKSVNSAFYGNPNLDDWLRREGIDQVVICGITTNHCCETTARMAGNLGYDTYFIIDATHTFDRFAPDGTLVPADVLAAITATNLHKEFATVVSTDAVTARR